MKKIIIMSMVLGSLLFTACTATNGAISSTQEISLVQNESPQSSVDTQLGLGPIVTMSMEYISFEEALGYSTDVVIAQYVGHRPFGRRMTEFEFVVSERILGNAADRIFVYVEQTYASVFGSDAMSSSSFNTGDISFSDNTSYLLALRRVTGVHLNTHEDGYRLTRNLVINLDAPVMSVMYNEPLSLHSTEINFNSRTLYYGDIVKFVRDMTANNPPARERVQSNDINDIIGMSPYVLVVEVGEPISLSSGQSDWMATDIYHATVLEILKGDITCENTFRQRFEAIVFAANTVRTGERHIVALEPSCPVSMSWFRFTSNHSLFALEQLDEIRQIIEG